MVMKDYKTNGVLFALFIFFVDCAVSQNSGNTGAAISSHAVTTPQADAVNFWTPERMKNAKELVIPVPSKNVPMNQPVPSGNSTPITIPNLTPDSSVRATRAVSASGRQVPTTGRVFWSCTPNILYSCSGSVIPSTSGDLIVTAAQCVFDTTKLQWQINCNWVFAPGFSNGNAYYGLWPARKAAALTAWTQPNPNYNYDVAFVALSTVSFRHVSQYTGSEMLGFNYGAYQPTYAFGYPLNIGNAQNLQYCSGIPQPSAYRSNGYVGQGLGNCGMGGGIAGGPWMQQFSTSTGVGVVYSLNSFFYSSAPNTTNGPIFDGYVYSLWSYMQNQL